MSAITNRIKLPESDSQRSVLMLLGVFALFAVAGEIQSPIEKQVFVFGTLCGFIVFVREVSRQTRLEAGAMRHLEDNYYTKDAIAHRQELYIKRIIWLGNITGKSRDFWAYRFEVEPHSEVPLKNFGEMDTHIRIMPDRIDKILNFLPRKTAARRKGEGPFDHGASDIAVSIVSPLPHTEAGKIMPVHFDVWGSKLYSKILPGWDEAVKDLTATDVDAIVSALQNQKGRQIYPSEVADYAVHPDGAEEMR